MKLNTKELSEAINDIAKFVGNFNHYSDKNYCKLTTDFNTAYFRKDMQEKTIIKKLPYTGDRLINSVWIDIIAFKQILSTFPKKSDVQIVLDTENINIICNDISYNIEYMTIQEQENESLNFEEVYGKMLFENMYKLPSKYIEFIKKEAINFISKNDFRLQMTGLFFHNSGGRIKLAATDTYKLIVNVTDIEVEREVLDFIMPAHIIPLLTEENYDISYLYEVLERQVSGKTKKTEKYNKYRMIKLVGKTTELIFEPIIDKFPPYESVIPKTFEYKLHFSKENLSQMVKKAETICKINKDDSYQIKFSPIFNDEGKRKPNFDLTVNEPYDGERDRIAQNIGKAYCLTKFDGKFGFNVKYLKVLLSCLKNDNIKLLANMGDMPFCLQEENITYLLMPVRVS